MSGPEGIACGTCIFADLKNLNDTFCRRYPATLVVMKAKDATGKTVDAVRHFYPSIQPVLDWCGEHSAGQANMTKN